MALQSGQGLALELIPESAPGPRFRFQPGQGDRTHPEIGPLLGCDEVIMEDERLGLYARGRLVRDLSAHGWVWWHERALQAPFWRRILQIRELQAQDLHGGHDAQPEAPPADPETERLRRNLQRLMDLVARPEGGIAGFTPGPVRAVARGRLLVELSKDPQDSADRAPRAEGLVLEITDSRQGGRRLFAVGPFAVSQRGDEALGPDARRALAVLHDRLTVAWRRVVQRLTKT